MSEATRLEVLARGWRGRVIAALIALVAALPGLIALPTVDRDEARFAQSTAQMLETGDFVSIDYQDQARSQAPVLIHWLQAASVALVSHAEARQIWAYRIPSVLGAMLAAAACAWGAQAVFGAVPGLVAGAILGASMLLSTEAGLATTDAVLCGTVTLTMAAFARLYAAAKGELVAGWRTKLLFWLGLALAILDEGPAAAMIVGLALVALAIWDRRAPWARSLGWTWGILLVCAVAGPWAMAITVRTDGGFWTGAIGGGLASTLSGDNSHTHPPGFHVLLAPLLIFPAAALLPAAGAEAWRGRALSGVRVAIAWLVPAWLAFELLPSKLPHDTLPLYGALAWLAAFAMTRPLARWRRWAGTALSLAAGLVLAALLVAVAHRFGAGGDLWLAFLAAGLAVLAGAAGAAVVLTRYGLVALAAAGVLGIAAHGLVVAGVGPRLSALWTSRAVVRALDRAKLDPLAGLIPGPVAVVGYAEPSLVFSLGTETEIGDVGDAGEAISEGSPVVVEAHDDAAFAAELAADKLKAAPAAVVTGYDYSRGQPVRLTIYRSLSPPPEPGPAAP
ncbi:MAG TPA: glycosyltransferase family 39 protein [Caulobacteraceae bacterium]|nr:glycosyltransferase family 39 protein [Caulobacteraceae bacterium]